MAWILLIRMVFSVSGYLAAAASSAAPASACAAGAVRVLRVTNPAFDRYTSHPPLARQQWLREHFWRMVVFSPYFDSRLAWYPEGALYLDLYGLHTDGETAAAHPEWLLRDLHGAPLYIPWGCANGACPQYAADVSNPAYREWWIGNATLLLRRGYRNLFIDDVNMEFRVSNGDGRFTAPIDPKTGAGMSWDGWRRNIAEFTEAIRAALPDVEITHNAIWFAGPAGVASRDPCIRRQIAAADYQFLEYGVNDEGLTGGNGRFSFNELLAHIDRVHELDRGIILSGVPAGPPGAEYALAGYFAISAGNDAIGSGELTPDNWWKGFDASLGAPLGPRAIWKGLVRRDFSGGLALLNPPGGSAVTAALPAAYRTLEGSAVTSITLSPGEGAVLLSAPAAARAACSSAEETPIRLPEAPNGRRR